MPLSPRAVLLAADTLLVIHALFIAFVLFGLLLVLAGIPGNWRWTRNPWFRLAHLGAIGVVVLQSWLGMICPLTTWEHNLRQLAGHPGYAGSFVQHWLHRLIFYQAEAWVFTLSYTLFGALVVLAWLLAPPSSFPRRRAPGD